MPYICDHDAYQLLLPCVLPYPHHLYPYPQRTIFSLQSSTPAPPPICTTYMLTWTPSLDRDGCAVHLRCYSGVFLGSLHHHALYSSAEPSLSTFSQPCCCRRKWVLPTCGWCSAWRLSPFEPSAAWAPKRGFLYVCCSWGFLPTRWAYAAGDREQVCTRKWTFVTLLLRTPAHVRWGAGAVEVSRLREVVGTVGLNYARCMHCAPTPPQWGLALCQEFNSMTIGGACSPR